MRSEFNLVPISSLCSLISSGGTPSRKHSEYYDNGVIKWLKTKELFDTNIYNTEEHITELGLKKSSAKLYPANTVVMAMYGATVGQLGIMKSEMSTNQACCCMVVDENKADYKYLFYSLLHNRNGLINLANGAAQQNLNSQIIKDFKISTPQLSSQKKIAHILSTLDDKIELNRKMNQTLEEMAQAIFKSWFVDFDPVHAKAKCSSDAELEEAAKELGISKEVLELFPSEFEESELGMIPKGWSVDAMQNLISVKDGTHDSPKAKDEGYPLVTSKHIKNGVIDLDTANLISEEDFNKVNQRSKVEQYDILIGMIGTIGDLYYVSEENVQYAIKNIGLFKTSEAKDLSVFMYFWLDTSLMRNYIISRLAGTTQKYISLTELRKLPVLIPSQQLLDKYRNLASNMLETIASNNKEIQTLQQTRDTLLPKLLSGELAVSELNIGGSDV